MSVRWSRSTSDYLAKSPPALLTRSRTMIEDIKKDAVIRMTKCVQTFAADTKKLCTGRAHPSLIEHLKVDYYGSETLLQQVANISVEDGCTLVISPWEKIMVQAIEKT